jgi:hypothetical protein
MLLGGSGTAAHRMPVALTFITVNIIGALIYMGGEPGLAQPARSVGSITAFALADPLFVLMEKSCSTPAWR